MLMNPSDLMIIAAGCLVAASGGLLGSFLMLRRSSLIADAISHAILPGLVIGFLLAGSRHSLPMLISASVAGLLAAILIEKISRFFKIHIDVSTGLVFTFFFAVGVIMVSRFTGHVDLDQDCILYGDIVFIPLYADPSRLLPPPLLNLVFLFALNLGFVGIGYRGLFATTFDPGFSQTIGMKNQLWNYLLMGMVSLTTVISFNLVGSILVIAMMVVPAAIAYLLTRQLYLMLILSVICGSLASTLGYVLAAHTGGSVAGAMACALGVVFATAFLGRILYKFVSRKTHSNAEIPTAIGGF
jgi:manganese/zinc/iron transport system permease protein